MFLKYLEREVDMKVIVGLLFASVLVSMLVGCASDIAYVPKIPPHAQAKLLNYFEQPGNKVFIIAIDPSGNYAFGYDYGKPTLTEAAEAAFKRCKANRESSGVVARPYVYALNDTVVYEEMIRKAHEGGAEEELKAQKEELEKEDAAVNPQAVKEQVRNWTL